MAKLWSPDTCVGGQCTFEILDDHSFVAIEKLCPHHQRLRGQAASDKDLFDRATETNRAKNFGTFEVALEHRKDNPNFAHNDVKWRIDDEDRVVITSELPQNRRNIAATNAAGRVGAGKVIVE